MLVNQNRVAIRIQDYKARGSGCGFPGFACELNVLRLQVAVAKVAKKPRF
jgi:hypothetical protein